MIFVSLYDTSFSIAHSEPDVITINQVLLVQATDFTYLRSTVSCNAKL